MCFDLDSQPPVDVTAAPGVVTERKVLTSPDGNRFVSYDASPRGPVRGGVVVLPDMRGIYPFYEGLAVDLANHGYRAVVIDYYGRTAGTGLRGEEFDPTAHVMRTTTAGVQADIVAGADDLRSHGIDRVACLGFCFGGRHAFLTSAAEFGFAGVIGFYGIPGIAGPLGAGPTQKADQLAAPILGIFGGADDYIPVSEVDAFDAALTEQGIDHEIEVFAGAPHSFFDVKHDEHRQASTAAWQATHRFLERVTQQQAPAA